MVYDSTKERLHSIVLVTNSIRCSKGSGNRNDTTFSFMRPEPHRSHQYHTIGLDSFAVNSGWCTFIITTYHVILSPHYTVHNVCLKQQYNKTSVVMGEKNRLTIARERG